MRYSGIQPQYFPRLHYFARILNADIFMIRDDSQFVRKHRYPNDRVDKSYQAHTPIKQSFGTHLLATPTKHEGRFPIAETKISEDHTWRRDHLKTLEISYRKAPNFSKIQSDIEEILATNLSFLSDLNTLTICWGIYQLLGSKETSAAKLTIEFINQSLKNNRKFRLKEIKRASESKDYQKLGRMSANEKIVALCKEVGATEDYCGGTGVATYMDEGVFKKHGIKTVVQDWKCKEYPQQFIRQQGFIPNLSIIDLLMNVPLERAVEIIKG